ncbi:MAG: FAD-dependent monooxygenase [Rhodococcus sp. (in: high G+C Gram-positive bacteria)]
MKVLISGGSVAGLTTALILKRAGHAVTVLERSTGPRQGGVAVDVRGAALDVARDLGILDELRDRKVAYEDRFSFVDRGGKLQAAVEPSTDVYDSPDDLEISRDDLVGILGAKIEDDGIVVHHGSSIAAMRELDSHVEVDVNAEHAWTETFDLVVGADGMHSSVRRLAFGPEEKFVRHLGLYVGVIRKCRTNLGVSGTTVYNEPGRMVMVRGDGHEQSVILGYRSPLVSYDYRDVDIHRHMLASAFTGDRGWKFPELRAEISAAPDLYFDTVSQVKMSTWARGRVALVGDAGYCASFFSGMGTSLAMLGAAALARALTISATSPISAGYSAEMRPIVDAAHDMAAVGATILFPSTEDEIALRNSRYPLRTDLDSAPM